MRLPWEGAASCLTKTALDVMKEQLNHLKPICAKLGLVISDSRRRDLFMRALMYGERMECSVAAALINDLVSSAKDELMKVQFAYIPKDKAEYFEQSDLFGRPVTAAFPSACSEIKDAGNCIAAGLHTAAVFHLMRVAERGMRSLARRLHVSKVKNKTPIEFGSWEHIIAALEAKAGLNFPKTKAGQAESEFYKGLFVELRAFKDFWRNAVMHTRADYDEHWARSAFVHVRAFVQRLSTRVKETN